MNWNMLAGFAGLVSVGQQAFVGIGAYAMFAAIILLELDPLAGVLLGGVAAALFAIPMAFFVFRLNGAYFAIGTWVVADIVKLGMGQWKALGGGTGTSLPKGTTRDMLGVDIVKEALGVSGAAAADAITYWLMLTLAVVLLIASYVFLRSRMGLGLQAIRDNENAARSVGVDPLKLKASVFLLTAFGTGICGALAFIQITRVTPDAAFSVIDWTAFVIFITVIGGIGTLPGPIVGVIVFYALQTPARRLRHRLPDRARPDRHRRSCSSPAAACGACSPTGRGSTSSPCATWRPRIPPPPSSSSPAARPPERPPPETAR